MMGTKFLRSLALGAFLLWGGSAVAQQPDSRLAIYGGGQHVGEGFYTPAVVAMQQRPSPDKYLRGVVKVKLREALPLEGIAQALPIGGLNSLLMKFNTNEIQAAFPAFNHGAWLSRDEVGLGRIYEIRFDPVYDAWDVAQEIAQDPAVEYATPAYTREMLFRPNDPRYANQYEHQIIRSEQAWAITRGSPNVVLAISDSGTDWQHEDLADNIWMNPNETLNGRDDDGNGYVDDIRGWDFVGDVSGQEAAQGIFRPDNDPRVDPPPPANDQAGRFHGTHVAGCAAATTNNGRGVAAIGANCTIMALKFGSDRADAGLSAAMLSEGYKSIVYAGQMGAAVVNCSWGTAATFDPTEQDAVNFATSQGTLVIAASGNSALNNDEVPHFPTNYRHVLSVGASDQNDRPSNFTNYGARVNVFAPGVNIMSTMPGNSYQAASGTSMAAPIVAGIVGLVKTLNPTWTPYQLAHQIRSTSEDVLASKVNAPRPLFYGRANAARAVSINRNFASGNRIPGISLSEHVPFTVNAPGGIITDGQEITLRLNVKNFLAPAQNMRLRVVSPNGVFSIANPEHIIPNLGTLDSQIVEINLRVSEDNPWIETLAELQITYTVGAIYENYEAIDLPVRSVSTNRVTSLPPYNAGNAATAFATSVWSTVSSPSSNVLWAGGLGIPQIPFLTRSSIMRADASGVRLYQFGPQNFTDPVSVIFGMSAERAVAASRSTNGQRVGIHVTANGGQTWTNAPVQTLTQGVQAIHMFDNNSGVFIGEPATGGNSFVLARTNNGGSTWAPVNITGRRNDESFINQSADWRGSRGWFGTNEGRVFYTTNNGQSWQVATVAGGSPITSLAFSSDNSGIATFVASNGAVRVAATTNGGRNWSTLSGTLFTPSFRPARAFSPEADKLVLVGSDGSLYATDDNGSTWRRVKTVDMTGQPLTADSRTNQGNTLRLWKLGTGTRIVMLDYTLEAAAADPTLTFSAESVAFGNVPVGGTATRQLRITNGGDRDVQVVSIDIFGGGGFSFVGTRPTVIGANSSVDIQVAFSPNQTGNRQASLSILSDAANQDVAINLTGTGVEASVLRAAVDTLYFRETSTGTINSQNLVFTAEGNSPVTVSGMRIEGDTRGAFSITASLEGSTVNAGASATARLAFAPTSVEEIFATLVVEQADGQETRVVLAGQGVVNSILSPRDAAPLRLAPNPADDNIRISYTASQAGELTMQVFTVRGETVLEQRIVAFGEGEQQVDISVRNLSAGAYFIVLRSPTGQLFEGSFIKQ